MDAWQTLTAKSTLASGDAWQHLNAQAAGTVIAGEASLIIEEIAVEIEADDVIEVTAEDADQVTVDVEGVTDIIVDAAPITVETC